jgi:hypothetical protein
MKGWIVVNPVYFSKEHKNMQADTRVQQRTDCYSGIRKIHSSNNVSFGSRRQNLKFRKIPSVLHDHCRNSSIGRVRR